MLSSMRTELFFLQNPGKPEVATKKEKQHTVQGSVRPGAREIAESDTPILCLVRTNTVIFDQSLRNHRQNTLCIPVFFFSL